MATYRKDANYPWQRYWIPHGETPAMDDGYFVEPATDKLRLFSRHTNGVPLASLSAVPCVVLLGDVGMGKSRTAEAEAAALSAALASQNHAVVLRNLHRVHVSQITRQILGDPKVQGWIRGDHALTLFLDSLDECWRRIDELESILVGELEPYVKRDRPHLYLRLLCRSAEWRPETGDALRRLFHEFGEPDKIVKPFTLAPLCKSNIRQAAVMRQLDGEDLLHRIAEKDAQALASHPITFEMLFDIYRTGGDFPGTRVELYERGCLRLCVDRHSESTVDSQRYTSSTQRLAIAGRLAAVSVLTNRYLINGDLERPTGREDVLDVSKVLGHYEEPTGGEQVKVDKDTARETLQTALFGECIEGVQPWRHQSYAEFLGARYLAARGLLASQLAALLTEDSRSRSRIVPQLEETACWLADMVPPLFSELAPMHADVFIRCDPKNLDDEHRATLVKGYLDLVRRHEASEVDWPLKPRFARLAHSGLPAVLRPVIADTQDDPLVREAAIEIAAYCHCREAALEIMSVFLDSTAVFRVRKHAGLALEMLANDEIRALLKSRVRPEQLDDALDELKGYYLTVLWPTDLTVEETLALLTVPKKRSYFGSYRSFIEYKFVDKVPDCDLPKLLDWIIANDVDFDIVGPYGYFGKRIAVRALALMDRPEICDRVLTFIKEPDRETTQMFHSLSRDDGLTPEAVLTFWRAVVATDTDLQTLFIYGDLHQAGLLQPAHLDIFIQQHRLCVTAHEKPRWRTLIFAVFNPEDSAALDRLSELANGDPAVAEALTQRTSCPLLSDEKNWMKENHLRQQERARECAARDGPRLDEAIGGALDKFEQGEVWRYWQVMEWLQMDPNERAGMVFPGIRLTKGKAWATLATDLRRRILTAGVRYLESQSVSGGDVWDDAKSYRAYDLLVPLMILLYDEDPTVLENLSPPLWSKWTPALFAYHGRQNGNHDDAMARIFTLMFQNTPAAVGSLTRFLELHINHDHKRSLIWRLNTCWCSPIESTLFAVLQQGLKPTAAMDVLDLLFDHAPVQTQAFLENTLKERDGATSCNVLAPGVAALLLKVAPEQWGQRLVGLFEEEPSFGRVVIPLLLCGGGRRRREWLAKLSEQTTADFWLWLETNFPGDPYEDQDGAGEVTIAHDMFHFRRGVLENLIKRGTRESCAALESLMQRRPHDFWLGHVLAEMRKAARRSVWTRASPEALMQSFADREKRLIRSAGDLHDLLIESLRRYEDALHAPQPIMELWNEVPSGHTKILFPKDEANLSTCLKRHLERDLDRRGILAGREVEIRPRLGEDPAQLVDILVQAIPFGQDGNPGSPVTVVIEVKCAWNNGVFDDMERQLFRRYLANTEYDFGIYVVAHFTCPAWNNTEDGRNKRGASPMAIDQLVTRLSTQASDLTTTEKKASAMVLDARLVLTPS